MRVLIAGLTILGLVAVAVVDARRMKQAADTNAKVSDLQRRLEACETREAK